MEIILSVLILLASLLLIGVVLIQKSKGGGLASNVSSYNQIAGVRKTTDFVEKATWFLAIFICVLSIGASVYMSHASGAAAKSQNLNPPKQEQAPTPVPTETPAPAPAAPAK